MNDNTRAGAIRLACEEIAANFIRLRDQAGEIDTAARMMIEAVAHGKKVLFCGNGGSAADAQHLAAELMGRYMKERRPLPAVALTVDTSALTAIGNDYGFAEIFARQVAGLGEAGDVLVAISTSGNSENVVKALEAARERGMKTIGLTGENGGRMKDLCGVCIRVPSSRTNHIQEMHIAIGHLLCGLVEESL